MRISDWSSDVCSSDLFVHGGDGGGEDGEDRRHRGGVAAGHDRQQGVALRFRRPFVDEGGAFPLPFVDRAGPAEDGRSEEHTSELQSLMRISYAVFCLKKKKNKTIKITTTYQHHITQKIY